MFFKDSSFAYDLYSELIIGKWLNTTDSLYLYGKDIIYKNEIIKKYNDDSAKHIFLAKPIVFAIHNNYLIRLIPIKNNKKIIEKLKFNTP